MTPSELIRNLESMRARANDLAPVLRAIGDLMVASADRNFEAEGRPAWKPVRPATARRKAKAGHSRILMWSGALARSITFQVQGRKVVLGTNSPYGRIHQEGGVIQRDAREFRVRFRLDAKGKLLRRQIRKGGSDSMLVFAGAHHKRAVAFAFTHGPYQIRIPARPYLTFQPGEQDAYGALVLNFVLTGQIGARP